MTWGNKYVNEMNFTKMSNKMFISIIVVDFKLRDIFLNWHKITKNILYFYNHKPK